MTDAGVILELLLMLALPAAPIAVGAMLRRKFSPPADGSAPLTAGGKAARFAGTLLLWLGVAGAVFMAAMALHFKGKLL